MTRERYEEEAAAANRIQTNWKSSEFPSVYFPKQFRDRWLSPVGFILKIWTNGENFSSRFILVPSEFQIQSSLSRWPEINYFCKLKIRLRSRIQSHSSSFSMMWWKVGENVMMGARGRWEPQRFSITFSAISFRCRAVKNFRQRPSKPRHPLAFTSFPIIFRLENPDSRLSPSSLLLSSGRRLTNLTSIRRWSMM